MFESKSGVLLIAGLGFFSLAFLSNGLVPMLMYSKDKFPERTAEQEVNRWVIHEFKELMVFYSQPMQKHYFREVADRSGSGKDATPDKMPELFAQLQLADQQAVCGQVLREGRKVYVAEGCWHCHSQFVRPVSNEERRWGPVSKSGEYQNELQRPVMFGTRRVGPDLSREGGRHGNDWHTVHFFRPRMTSPQSVMPEYPWFFDLDAKGKPSPGQPNRRGLAIILYMQWLGSWLDSYPYYDLDRKSEGGT